MSEFENKTEQELAEEQAISEENEYVEEYRYIDTGSPAASVLGGLVGMFIALILSTAIYGIFGRMPYVLLFLFPLCVCFISLLFKGSLNIGGLICEIIFTAIGIIIHPAFFISLHYAKANGTSFLSVPLIALTEIGNCNLFTNFSFSTSTVFPVIIAVIGIIISWQIFKLKKAKLYD